MKSVKMTAMMAALAAGLMTAGGALAQEVRVMTFNVRFANPADGANVWSARREVFMRTVREADADVIGTQELLRSQGEDLVTALPGYRWFGRDRLGGHDTEYMGIFYRADRLRLLRSGDFWLSETPEKPGSISWGANLPRMVTWGVFETMRDKKPLRFVMANTHFAHRGAEDEEARTSSAALIAKRLPTIARGLPIVLTGDLNTRPDSAAVRRLTAFMTDASAPARTKDAPSGTFHDFTGTAEPGKWIDYVMVKGFRPVSASVLTTHDGARYPSDHFPIVAVVKAD
ncbi:endonuclease/exonuclease/phosphatase family protein [Sphingomonas sp. Leaf231]|uniref:endonuclease/exonuclease/phosphatase family protein n=1 Tax=Sphingomonas sp. Leaf231 TaxID=1736301 RepID=UPI000A5A9938|nr:endonuclease/exonuclease/phosphatase family protein [Sphingomonas sp. Leaf231]